jgi:hypothetical protein
MWQLDIVFGPGESPNRASQLAYCSRKEGEKEGIPGEGRRNRDVMLKFRDHWRPSPGRWEKGDGRV